VQNRREKSIAANPNNWVEELYGAKKKNNKPKILTPLTTFDGNRFHEVVLICAQRRLVSGERPTCYAEVCEGKNTHNNANNLELNREKGAVGGGGGGRASRGGGGGLGSYSPPLDLWATVNPTTDSFRTWGFNEFMH